MLTLARPNAVRRTRGNPRRSNKLRGKMSRAHEHMAAYRGIVSYPSFIPPRVLSTPWNSLVVSWTFVNGTTSANRCFDIFTDLASAFRAQCGLPTTVDVGFRIISQQFWHLAPNGELNNKVQVRFMSLIEGVNACTLTDTLAQVQDFGTFTRNASAKFIWPKTHSSNAFPSASTRVISRLTAGPSQQVLIHTSILWKFVAPSTSLFNEEFTHMNTTLSELELS